MANPVTVKITGLNELQKKLEEMATKDAKAIIKDALKEGGAPVLDGMKQLCPEAQEESLGVPRGYLKKNLGIKFGRLRGMGNALAGVAYIGPQSGVDYPKSTGHWQTVRNKAGHVIKSVGRISVLSVARFLEFGTAHAPAYPFMRPAWNAKKQSALDAIIKTIKDRLGLQ